MQHGYQIFEEISLWLLASVLRHNVSLLFTGSL